MCTLRTALLLGLGSKLSVQHESDGVLSFTKDIVYSSEPLGLGEFPAVGVLPTARTWEGLLETSPVRHIQSRKRLVCYVCALMCSVCQL